MKNAIRNPSQAPSEPTAQRSTRPATAAPESEPAPDRRVLLLFVAGALLLRSLLILGRGDYLAFDEGFYLLLARSLFTGAGYSLIGIPHITLSPLFPILAGAAGWTLHSWVWGGRIVAITASALLVVPAWAIFHRLAPRRTAYIAVALVAVLPSLAPFVVPFWIGADLWVGAEPLLHLLLFSGIALWMRADARGGWGSWAASGALFGLAFLARPEAIVTWGLLGLFTLGFALHHRAPRRLGGATLMGIGFVVVATPYWIYLHDVTGRWQLTGRGVTATSIATSAVSGGGRQGSASIIERMLWQDDASYQQHLFGLTPAGDRMASTYWGVYPDLGAHGDAGVSRDSAADHEGMASGTGATAGQGGGAAGPAANSGEAGSTPTAPQMEAREGVDAGANRSSAPPSPFSLYFRAFGMILPLLLWPFVILGLAEPRAPGVLRREMAVTLSLAGTSVAIAALVAVDPRTQLFLVPLLAFYAARGFALVEREVRARDRDGLLRRGFVELLLASVAVLWLLSIDGYRLYMSLSVGSPHHVVAAQNRDVATELDTLAAMPPGPVMSWHPSLAVYADRDWRVLPFASLPRIIRYAGASGAAVIVLSAYYPPDLHVENLGTRYLILPVPPDAGKTERWNLQVLQGDSIARIGRLEPVPAGPRPAARSGEGEAGEAPQTESPRSGVEAP